MDLLVNIDVDDLELAIRFYTAAFPLRVTRRFGNDGGRGYDEVSTPAAE